MTDFLPCLSSDPGGVWLFRIHCQEAAVLRLSRLGCVTFFVYVLGLSSSPLGVPKVPLRPPANDRFLLRLSSDLGGVWLFRIHCQEAAALRLSRLGAVSGPQTVPFFASPELGFRWCLAVSHPWPRSCIFALVQARLRHVFWSTYWGSLLLLLSSDLGGVWLFRIHGRGAAFLRLSRLGCATFLVYVLGLFSSPSSSPSGVPKVPFRTRPVSHKKKLPPIDRGRRHGR